MLASPAQEDAAPSQGSLRGYDDDENLRAPKVPSAFLSGVASFSDPESDSRFYELYRLDASDFDTQGASEDPGDVLSALSTVAAKPSSLFKYFSS